MNLFFKHYILDLFNLYYLILANNYFKSSFMKKITFLLSALSVSLTSFAQQNDHYYNFTQLTSTYVDLVAPTSINNGQVWQFDDFGPFEIPFSVEVFGVEFNQFYFNDDFFYLRNQDTDEIISIVDPVTTYISDRGVIDGISVSPLSYKIEGTDGDRILKIEAKNIGLEDEEFYDDTTNLFLNYQIWLYESDKSIEFRYGPNNITSADKLEYMEDLWLPGLFLQNQVSGNVGYLEGDNNSATYNEAVIDENTEIEPVGLNAPVAANTVYRFSLSPLSVKDMEKVSFAMFPNPVQNILHLTFNEPVNKSYFIYDIIGRQVLKGAVKNTQSTDIDVSNLSEGSYILKMGNSIQKFIKK